MTDPVSRQSDARIAAEAELRRIAQAGESRLDIGHAALALAAYDDPPIRLEPYRRHLADLAADLGHQAKAARSAAARAAALAATILARWGYRAESEGTRDVESAEFARVLDRRKGLAVALGILAIHAARARGWRIGGLAFPGHFLLRLECAGTRAILDPATGARPDPAGLRRLLKAGEGERAELRPEHYADAPDRDVLLRLRNNLRLRLVRAGFVQRAAAVTRSMLLIAPERATLWREMGLLYAELGEVGPAISALQRFLDSGAADAARYQAAALLQKLRLRLT